LAAWDPFTNVSVVSLKDRRKVFEHFGLEVAPISTMTRLVEG